MRRCLLAVGILTAGCGLSAIAIFSGGKMSRLRRTPIVPLAYRDHAFMESVAARPMRILAEYLDPLVRLRKAGVGDTIVMFGSARMISRAEAATRLAQVQRASKGRSAAARKLHQSKVREARAALEMSRYYEEARDPPPHKRHNPKVREPRPALKMSRYSEEPRDPPRRITEWSLTLGDKPR